jgi:hypothetical protein
MGRNLDPAPYSKDAVSCSLLYDCRWGLDPLLRGHHALP